MRSEKFVPLAKLLTIPGEKLTSAQRLVVTEHRAAVEKFRQFTAGGNEIRIGQPTSIGQFPTAEENAAAGRAQNALRVAINYYFAHGKMEFVERDIKEAASGWHPEILERWDHYYGTIFSELVSERQRHSLN